MSKVTYIDLTPTWATTARIIAMVLRDGTEQGKHEAEIELLNMGKLLDKLLAERNA